MGLGAEGKARSLGEAASWLFQGEPALSGSLPQGPKGSQTTALSSLGRAIIVRNGEVIPMSREFTPETERQRLQLLVSRTHTSWCLCRAGVTLHRGSPLSCTDTQSCSLGGPGSRPWRAKASCCLMLQEGT